MSQGGRELDAIIFTDDCIPSFVSLNAIRDKAPKVMRTAEVLTETLYYADAETNTKHKKKDVEVTTLIVLSFQLDISGETHQFRCIRRK